MKPLLLCLFGVLLFAQTAEVVPLTEAESANLKRLDAERTRLSDAYMKANDEFCKVLTETKTAHKLKETGCGWITTTTSDTTTSDIRNSFSSGTVWPINRGMRFWELDKSMKFLVQRTY